MKCEHKKRHVPSHTLRKMNLLHLNVPETVYTRRITFERPTNPVDGAEPPKRSRADDGHGSALLCAYHHDSVAVSENLNNETGVFKGTWKPDMLDKACLRSKPRRRNVNKP